MAQKPLGKGNSKKKIQKVGKGLKKVSGNKGKLYEKTKKGGRNIVPKKKGALDTAKEMERLSKVINAKNEENSAAKATNAADKLNILTASRAVCESLKAKPKSKKR